MPDTRREPATTTVVGVEVDGTRVAVVQVLDGAVVASRVLVASTPGEALRRALDGLPAGVPVRVAVARDATASGRILTDKAPRDHEELTAAVAAHAHSNDVRMERLLDSGVSLTGAFLPPGGLALRWSGLVLGWPTSAVETITTALADHRGPVQVVAPPLAAAAAGDTVLALRDTDTTLTLAADGVPVAVAVLKTGGLGGVEATLGGGQDVGADRVEDALAHGGLRDVMAGTEVDNWLRDLLAETVTQLDAWERQGLPVSRSVHVYGRAARAAGLDFLLTDYGLTRALLPPRAAKALMPTDAGVRHNLVGAYLAASVDTTANPVAVFQDPGQARRSQRAATGRRRRAIAARATLALLLTAGPVTGVTGWNAWVAVNGDAAIADLATGAGLSKAQVRAVIEAAQVTPLPASWPVGELAANVPAGVLITRAALDGGNLALHGTTPHADALTGMVAGWEASGFRLVSATWERVKDGWDFVVVVSR